MEFIVNHETVNEHYYILTHWQNSIEIAKVEQGEVHCLVNGRTYTLNAGDICIINRNELHKMSPCQSEATLFSLYIPTHAFNPQDDVFNDYIKPMLENLSLSHMIIPKDTRLAREIGEEMLNIKHLEQDKPLGYKLLSLSSMYQILQRMYLVFKGETYKIEKNIDEDSFLYRRMADFVYHNFAEKISVDDIAKTANIGRNKCFALFKKFAQQTPNEFITLYRLEVACFMLKESNESIAQVAAQCGFNQQSYFGSIFQRQFNLSPKEYRHKFKKVA